MPVSTEVRDALRRRIIKLMDAEFPYLRGRVKLLPNGPPVAIRCSSA